jgi:hypothetical protein
MAVWLIASLWPVYIVGRGRLASWTSAGTGLELPRHDSSQWHTRITRLQANHSFWQSAAFSLSLSLSETRLISSTRLRLTDQANPLSSNLVCSRLNPSVPAF